MRHENHDGASSGTGDPVRDAFTGEASAKLAQERINTVSDQCCAEDVIRPADPSLPTAHGLRQRRKKLLEELALVEGCLARWTEGTDASIRLARDLQQLGYWV